MTKIYIVRHGETDWNRAGKLQGATDVPLNEEGRKQAVACGKFFEDIAIQAIFTSPLQRASKTAKIINEQLHLPLIQIDAFRERTFGTAEGMTYEERSKVYPRKNYPNQESFKAFRKRLVRGLQEIYEAYPDEDVALIAHGAVIHTLFQIVQNADFFPKNARLSNGGVSTIYSKGGEWWLEAYNDTHHLPKNTI